MSQPEIVEMMKGFSLFFKSMSEKCLEMSSTDSIRKYKGRQAKESDRP